ncbi:lipopolysaccharide biosynthesis protein [Cryobacterium sp. TMT2-4]|uniref:lipopolysaccharide biosynthesis protein n=1 Tax=Cryobacterium sp. TMT2-4 TaxID=1259254 RepID=UPI00106A50C5|nr:hypothetical protein E3O54_07235 [Cryobacterium sp. TMT2-4]
MASTMRSTGLSMERDPIVYPMRAEGVARGLARLPWRNVGGFSLLQVLAAIMPVLVLPVVTRIVGPEGWVALAIGFSMGGVVAILANFGWTLTGPGLVAGEVSAAARETYAESVHVRVIACTIAAVCAGFVAAELSNREYMNLAVLMTVAVGMNGLSASWYFLGRSQPGLIALTDVGPKALAATLSIPLILITHDPSVYPILLIAASVVGLLASNLMILNRLCCPVPSWRSVRLRARLNASTVGSGLVIAGYGAFSVSLSSFVSGAAVAVVASFAASVRLRAMAQAVIVAVSSGLQGWAIEKNDGRHNWARMRASLIANTLVGALTGTVFVVLAPWATFLIFGPGVNVSFATALWTGIACFLYSVSASLTYHVLAPTGHLQWIAASTTAAAIVGVPLLLLLTPGLGADGASMAVMIAEAVVVAAQLPKGIFVLRSIKHAGKPNLTDIVSDQDLRAST